MKLNGRWFPQIVDMDIGNLSNIYPPFFVLIFDPKGGGRFPQIVDGESGNLYQIYPQFSCSDF